MIFGSSEFASFDDIPMPRRRQDLHNPGLLLESQRFFSEANVRYLRVQETALRAAGVKQPITTNVCHMYSGGDAIDPRALFETLDVAGWDCYPRQFGADPAPMSLLHAAARAYKGGRAHWMLEQQSGSPMAAVADDPRRSRMWTWQSIAHGAELILYFRWRTCRFGGEQYWRGILDHDGEVNARYAIVARAGRRSNGSRRCWTAPVRGTDRGAARLRRQYLSGLSCSRRRNALSPARGNAGGRRPKPRLLRRRCIRGAGLEPIPAGRGTAAAPGGRRLAEG